MVTAVTTVGGESLGLSQAQKLDYGTGSQTLKQDRQDLAERTAARASVNVFTGNLVVQDQDLLLIARGEDLSYLRTYNSQGRLEDDATDNWLGGVQAMRLVLEGKTGEAGSAIVRIDRDGARARYTFDASSRRYVTTEGSGAHDHITAGATTLRWTDGASQNVQTYEKGGAGRLLGSTDASGNTTAYAWHTGGPTDGLPDHVTDASGDTIRFDYEGRNLVAMRTLGLRTIAPSGADIAAAADAPGEPVTLSIIRYEYDFLDRLTGVLVDLSPEDNVITDGRVYRTTYAYDGDSRRLSRIAQTNGGSLAIAYVEVAGQFKVASLTDAMGRVTRYGYGADGRSATVTDATGSATRHTFDEHGRLVETACAFAGAETSIQRFEYDVAGNLVRHVDGEGRATTMGYDAAGNQVSVSNDAGQSTMRAFDGWNRLTRESVRIDDKRDASTYFVYDQARPSLLRFKVSAAGRVTEYRYDTLGQCVTEIGYDDDAAAFMAEYVRWTGPGANALVEWKLEPEMVSMSVEQNKL
jgi:YD repeat-containing protein